MTNEYRIFDMYLFMTETLTCLFIAFIA